MSNALARIEFDKEQIGGIIHRGSGEADLQGSPLHPAYLCPRCAGLHMDGEADAFGRGGQIKEGREIMVNRHQW